MRLYNSNSFVYCIIYIGIVLNIKIFYLYTTDKNIINIYVLTRRVRIMYKFLHNLKYAAWNYAISVNIKLQTYSTLIGLDKRY